MLSADEFDPQKSTEDNFSVIHFTGPHADIRPLLDYTYHRKYTEARVKLQDELIERCFTQCAQAGNEMLPWIVFTAGAMGAGKGFVTRWMDQHDILPLQNFIVVDPDQIRQMLPEWKIYVQRDASTAGDLTQKEAGCIAEILGYRGLRERYNVIFDGSLRDTSWYLEFFTRLRREFPGIRIMILHIIADEQEVLQRAEERGRQTGRVVPVELLLESMAQVPQSVRALAPEADFVCRVVNASGRDPEVQRVEGVPFPPLDIPVTWEQIKKLWSNVDLNGDGRLSRNEVTKAMQQGLLTARVLSTLDLDEAGCISQQSFDIARARAKQSGTKQYK